MTQKYRTLADYFEQTGATNESLAEKLGISAAYVSLLRHHRRQPSLDLALRLHRATGVPLESMVLEDSK